LSSGTEPVSGNSQKYLDVSKIWQPILSDPLWTDPSLAADRACAPMWMTQALFIGFLMT